MRTALNALLAAVLALAAAPALGQRIDEEELAVPVRVTNAFGKRIEQPIVVTVFQQPGRDAYPLLVLNHGRAVDRAGREKVGRARYSEASRWLAGMGWSVWVPTRIGYGASGTGEDPEDTGACSSKRYEPGYRVAAEQILQVVAFARQRPGIDPRRLVVMGQSFGGASAIAVAALAPDGLVAAINFAGGGGGNPDTRPGEPCDPAQLARMFGGYGRTARAPTLWVYTENDLFFRPEYTRRWFEAFREQGGRGEYLLLPAFGDNGHLLFSRGSHLWKPLVERFLAALSP